MFRNDFSNRDKIKLELLKKTNKNPFPPPPNRVDFLTNRPNFICGRSQKINKIRSLIERSITDSDPVLIEILGKQGIGKSTLICWIYEVMKKEGKLKQVPMTYLNAMGNPKDFKGISFYKQLINSFFQNDILKNLVMYSISKFVGLLELKGGKCKKTLNDKFANDDIRQLISNPLKIKSKIENENEFLSKIIELFKLNLIFLEDDLKFNPNFLVTIWSCFNVPTAFEARNAINASGSFRGFEIKTEAEAFETIKNLINLNLWVNSGQGTIIIVFDHLEACINNQKSDNFNTLFSLLLRLRQFNHLCIILSGTIDVFDSMQDVLGEDQRLQIANWSYPLSLESLHEDVVTEIVGKYFERFWRDKLYSPPENYKLYPFGQNAIKYIYISSQKDLRKTIRKLYEKIEEFRSIGKLKIISNFFEAIREYRNRKDIILSTFEQQYFIEKLLGREFQDKERSTKVELGIFNLFKILHKDPEYNFISDVKHEPPIGPKREKPDIFVEFFGRDISKNVKKVAFEVKIFTKGKEIPQNQIKKTHVLIKAKKVDYIWWITNVPLSYHKYDLSEDLKPHLGRTTEMDSTELAYASFSIFFKEIYNREPNGEESYTILKKMGIDVFDIKNQLEITKPLVKEQQQKIITPQPKIDEMLKKFKKEFIEPAKPKKAKKPTKKLIPRHLVELEDSIITTYIETIIKQKNTQKSMRKTTIFTELKKQFRISIESEEDKNRIAILSDGVGKNLGYRTTSASILFG